MLIGVCVSCHIWYSVVSFLYVSFNGLITSVGEERANFSLSITSYYSDSDFELCVICSERFPLPLGA